MHHRVVVNGLRVSWILITIWYELVIFLSSVRHCHWPDLARSSLAAVGHSSTQVLLVADPQILDHRSYPERGPYLTYVTRLVVDLNLRKNWWAALQKRPDAIVFLGDMMDGGRFNMSDEEYEGYYGRFRSIFAIPTGVPTYFIPGNHDVGLRASSSFSPHARSRYISHFGPLNSRVTIANHTFVLLDAPGLVEEDMERQRHGRTYTTWTPRAGGPVEFVRSIARENGNDPVVLLSHIPLSRDAFDCGPLREKGTIRQGIGLGYQNTLGKEATAFLLEELRPSVVFSGDDHDYCETWHPSLVDNAASQIREVSVKSLSMAMGIQRPGFQLLSLAPQGHLEDATIAPKRHADAPCVLPDQLTIYLSAYIPLLLASLFILLVANTIRAFNRPRMATKLYHYLVCHSSGLVILARMSVPPSYTWSTSTPSYSSLPLSGEESLEYTPRPGTYPPSLGTFIRSWEHASLVLENQEPAASLPTYGQNSTVSGEVWLALPKHVLRVVLKFEGRLNLSIADGPSSSSTSNILSNKVTLWCKDDSAESHHCPAALPFCFEFPQTFTSERRTQRLPPSFDTTFIGLPILLAKCIYTLRLVVTISRDFRLASWATTKSYCLVLNYRPRARARHRLTLTDSVLSALKTTPDDWRQLCATMDVRPNCEVEPIDCHLIIPAARTFALVDTIPFHIHLCGSSTSLRKLLPPTCPLLLPRHDSSGTSSNNQTSTSPIQVLITRQVVVEVNERRAFRDSVIGTGRVRPIPPPAGSVDETSNEICASWEGEVRCADGVTAPGFNIGSLVVKDYIMLVLTPPKSRTSPLRALQIAHPIRLVTDPWTDIVTAHPQDTC
ncbi:putative calcineurin-like phosphoesterase [Lyophyllum shimeji]|uniref:Calcineurin-like phosphoesterase n=1 Tax=Lyophyllum shimeji TaxID=47721 RepID=A0A9P3PJV7_LYOSH|nr:putative calcineurin-like phosphoesterase [Lyophyllum shimeji]